jgi:hypothetical protein
MKEIKKQDLTIRNLIDEGVIKNIYTDLRGNSLQIIDSVSERGWEFDVIVTEFNSSPTDMILTEKQLRSLIRDLTWLINIIDGGNES